MWLRNCADVSVTGSMPSAVNAPDFASSAVALLIAAFSAAMRSGGVSFGAQTPYQDS